MIRLSVTCSPPKMHTGTQNLLRENLSLKKYSNVITYENAQLKETLRRQKGYWADTAPPQVPPAAAATDPPEVLLPAGKERKSVWSSVADVL